MISVLTIYKQREYTRNCHHHRFCNKPNAWHVPSIEVEYSSRWKNEDRMLYKRENILSLRKIFLYIYFSYLLAFTLEYCAILFYVHASTGRKSPVLNFFRDIKDRKIYMSFLYYCSKYYILTFNVGIGSEKKCRNYWTVKILLWLYITFLILFTFLILKEGYFLNF